MAYGLSQGVTVLKGDGIFQEKRERSQMQITMTPLIDCVFLLLIFFMIATTFSPMPGIRVKLPPPGAPPQDKRELQQLILRISDPEPGMPYGTMVLNDQVASMDLLLGSFQRRFDFSLYPF